MDRAPWEVWGQFLPSGTGFSMADRPQLQLLQVIAVPILEVLAYLGAIHKGWRLQTWSLSGSVEKRSLWYDVRDVTKSEAKPTPPSSCQTFT